MLVIWQEMEVKDTIVGEMGRRLSNNYIDSQIHRKHDSFEESYGDAFEDTKLGHFRKEVRKLDY